MEIVQLRAPSPQVALANCRLLAICQCRMTLRLEAVLANSHKAIIMMIMGTIESPYHVSCDASIFHFQFSETPAPCQCTVTKSCST
jgi:hypothetical protein